MKYILLILCLAGCSQTKHYEGQFGSTCSVTQEPEGAVINCTDGSSATINNGQDGENGLPGLPGLDGNSCTVTQLVNGALIACGANSAVVLNGLDGVDSLAGSFGISEVLSPCGSEFDNHEVLLKLSNGLVLGLFDGGPHWDRLVLLEPEVTYDTNDGYGCSFSIDSEGNLN